MKPLKEYIYQSPGVGWDFDSWLESNNIQEVTEEVIDKYWEMTWGLGWSSRHSLHQAPPFQLLEFLEPIPIEKLQLILNKKYPEVKIEEIREPDLERSGIYLSLPIDLYNNKFKVFCNFLEKHQWYYSHTENSNIQDREIIFIEPLCGDVMNGYIRERCNNKVYHLCRKSLTSLILKSGLRTKGRDTKPSKPLRFKLGYREFPNRVFFFFCPKDKKLEDIIVDTANMFMKDIDLDLVRMGFDLLEVDLNDARYLRFYKDTMGTECSVYTYAYIPPKYIKKVMF